MIVFNEGLGSSGGLQRKKKISLCTLTLFFYLCCPFYLKVENASDSSFIRSYSARSALYRASLVELIHIENSGNSHHRRVVGVLRIADSSAALKGFDEVIVLWSDRKI